ncbi:MAG: aspartate aminotransferase family protein [Candidatus Latescibacteria bacterium]|nr:aspartate aminotransferase family protein [Candidatus Latescibacterota bacterium]
MASKEFPIVPRPVKPVKTENRIILGPTLPVAESIPILQMLRDNEPFSMRGQPPVVWDHAEKHHVYDAYGNKWLDWSSGVLVTNAGHGRREIRDAIIAETERGLIHTYCFPSEARAKLAKKLVEIAPPTMTRAFILTTGSETTECAIKLAQTWGVKHGGPQKNIIVTFDEAFHGRTLGSQLAGGIPALKEWIGDLDPRYVQVPFPGSNIVFDKSFDLFERTLADKGVKPENVAGVMSETYQGGHCGFMPDAYAVSLREWCDKYNVVMIYDEVQAGFGRTGKMWGFEHHGIVPDLMCLGKGMSSSLPIAAVIGKEDIMNLYGPGSMTSTHSGHPLGSVAALASIELIEREGLVENARVMGERLKKGLLKIHKRHSKIFDFEGRGLVYGFMALKDRVSLVPDDELAFEIIRACFEAGLLMFAPVGRGGGTVKISPPLCITADAIDESVEVFGWVVDEVVEKMR